MSATTHRLPGIDFTTLSRRRHVEKAVAAMRNAHNQADAESSRTIRECNLDAVVKSQRAVQQPQQPSNLSPVAITTSLPPHIFVAALLAVFVLVGGLLSLSNSARLRNAADGGAGVVAGSSKEWRDGVEVQVQP